MKKFLVLCVAMAGFIPAANATPVLYEFSASVFGEQDVLTGDPIADVDQLFADGTAVGGSFLYDAATAALATNVVIPNLLDFGLFSVYPGSVTGFSADIGGNGFSAAVASTIVGNSNPGDATFADGYFILAGDFPSGPVGSGFSGFSIGDFTLIGLTFFGVGGNDFLSDQSLLDPLVPGSLNTGINLVFEDSAGTQRRVQSFPGTIAISYTAPS